MKKTFEENLGKKKQKKTKIAIRGGRQQNSHLIYESIKIDGNEFFKERKFNEAIKKYTECIVSLDF